MTHKQLILAVQKKQSVIWPTSMKPIPASFVANMQWWRVQSVLFYIKIYNPKGKGNPAPWPTYSKLNQ